MIKKKVSVLIPLYNSENYIEASIQSVFNQTYPSIEIIIVDDGSSDNSYKLAKLYESENVKLIQQPNKGAAAARNTALSFATGDYIQYLDADDLLSPDKIEKQVAILDKNPDCISSCAWGRFVKNPNEARFVKQAVWADFKPVDWLVTAWNGGGMMQTACWLVPRQIAGKAGMWNENLTLHDDGEYFCRIILQSKAILFIETAKVYYRSELPHSLSRSNNRTAAKSVLDICTSYKNQILRVENSERTRYACMLNHLNFLYRFHPHHPDLLEQAKAQITELGFTKLPPVAGGRNFRRLARLIGFENALKLRTFKLFKI